MKKIRKVQSFYLSSKIVFYQFVFHNKIIVNYIGDTFYMIKDIDYKHLSKSSIQSIIGLFCTKDAIKYNSQEYFICQLNNSAKEKRMEREFKKRRILHYEYISR